MKKNKNNKKEIKFNEKKKNNSKKKFKEDEDDDDEEEEEERYQKKNKGNKRKIQEDNEDEEDDSIDDDGSEIGWNSDDEETYGHLFKSNNNQNNNDEEDDDDDEEEGGMLLSDILTSNTSKNDDKNNNNNDNKQSKKSSKEEDDDNDDDDDEGYDYGDSEDDNGNDDNEESDEYEFEREDDDENENDDDDDNNSNSNHNQLLAAIEKYSKSADTNTTTKTKSRKNLLQLTAESPYSSTLQNSDQKVSLDSLINSLQSDTTSQSIDQDTLKFVKNKLSEISKSISAPKYVHKVQSDRAERSITYEQSTTDMTKWQNIIVENKNAKTLDLRQDKRKLPSAKTLIHTYKPQTDMEKEVQMILLNSSQKNELDIEKSEEDELLQNKELSLQEIREKQAELAKVRSLLFYEQMKRHRINKIKSKTFHRILKKKREKKQINKKEYDEMVKKLKANGDIFDDDDNDNDGIENGDNNNGKETEEEMMRRIKERMNLRHKNTGKWARMALEHGKGSKSLRDAYHEAVLLGNELTKKANQINEEVVDPYENSIRRPKVDDNDNRSSKKLKIIDETVESLEGVLDSNQNVQNIDGKYKALFEMDFMKKAREQQQLKAKEEAQKLLREIEEMEEGLNSDSDVDGDNNNNNNNSNDKKSKDHNNKSKEEIQKHKEKLDLARKQMSSLMKGNKSMNLGDQIESNSITTTTTNIVPIKAIEDNPWLDASHHNKSRDLNIIIGSSNDNKKQKQKNSVIKEQKNSSVIIKTETENKNNIDNKNSNKNNKLKNKNENSLNNSTTITTKVEVKTETKSEPTRKPLLMQKSQQDLVNLAFAGPDLEAEFEALKEKTIDEELNISDKKRKILSEDKAGWGDWAGPGMTGVSKKTVQKRQRLLRNLEEKKAELKLGRTDSTLANVIVSEKRVKTSAKYKLTEVPHPFKTREEYERSIQMPVGNEWNAEHIVRKNTKPEILLRAGRIIEPIKLPKQNKGVEKSKK